MHHQRFRPLRVLVATTAAAVLTLSGCTSAGGGAANDTGSDGTLRVLAPSEPSSLNAVYIYDSERRIIGSLYDPLVGFNDDLEVDDSGLLPVWERVDDLTWEFQVREGVTFHDGSEMTAEDIAFSITTARDDPRSGYGKALVPIESISVVDDFTVRLTTEKPSSAVPASLTTVRGLPSDYYEEVGGEEFGRAPIATGPFELGQYQQGLSLTLERNDAYWDETGDVKTLEITWSSDPSSRVALLESDGADIVYDLPMQSLNALEGNEGIQLESRPSAAFNTVHIRHNAAPTDDPVVREAAALAIDQESIVSAVYGDKTGILQTQFLGQTIDREAAPEPSYDPERAKELLADYGSAPAVRLVYTTGFYPQDQEIGESVAGMLREVGFEVQQDPKEHLKLIEEVFQAEGGMNIYITTATANYPHPDGLARFFFMHPGTPGCTSPEFTEMANEALAATSEEEMNRLYSAIEQKALAEEFCEVPLAQQVNWFGVREGLSGFQTPALDSPDWSLVKFD